MKHAARVYVRRLRLPRRTRLKVGLALDVQSVHRETGHGLVWHHVVSELRRLDGVKLVRSDADVWLASGHDSPPDGRPLVVQVHEASWHRPELRTFLDPAFAGEIETNTRLAVTAAAEVITPSNAARLQVIDAYNAPPQHVHAIPHGVDHTVFRPGLSGGRERVGAPYVLSVAILHERKNHAALRRAASDLAVAGLPHVLVVVGNPAPGSGTPGFEAQATAEIAGWPGRIRHLRGLSQRDLAELIAGADVFCLPSFFEGFGLPALEAMACGVPVVVSDRGALPEVVDGAGLVVAPEPPEVSAALLRVLQDAALNKRMRSASVARAAAFSWRSTARAWLSVLDRAA